MFGIGERHFISERGVQKHVRYRVGTGKKINFWLYKWIGENTLVLNFHFCTGVQDCQARVSSYVKRIGDQLVWGSSTFTF